MAKRDATPTDSDVQTPATNAAIASRLVIPLTAAGRIDWARTGRKKDQIRRVVAEMKRKTPTGADDAGGDDATTKPAAAGADVFNEQWAGVLFDVAGQLESMAAVKLYGYTPEQAKIFAYTDAEKGLLAGPLTRVLNKHSSAWLSQYADECALAGLLLTVHAAKINALTTVAKPAAVARVVPRAAVVDTDKFLNRTPAPASSALHSTVDAAEEGDA
jgi:hypothetical protein